MKKFLLLSALVCSGVMAFAQLVNVGSVTKVPLPENVKVSNAAISPDGTFFVASDISGSGIATINVANGEQTVVAKNADFYGVVISDDCSNMMFRRTTTNNQLRYTSLHNVDLATGSETQLVAPSRHLAGYSFSSGSKFDLIIKFMLENAIYDIDIINEMLYQFHQPCIGV